MSVEVCEHFSEKVDGALTIDGYLKSYMSEDKKYLLFWDINYLQTFISQNHDDPRTICPGFPHYSSLQSF